MAYENLCMYCFKELGDATQCPHCGKDANAAVPQIQLLPGTRVYHDRFLIGRALGQDSVGIVYTALDTKKGNTIRIREYMPRNCAERLNDSSVVPIAGMEDAFDTGMRKLKASVETAEDPKKRHFYFEENGTAYIAQRRNTAMSANIPEEDLEEDEPKRHTALFLGIGALVVALVAVGIFMLLNNMKNADQTVNAVPSPSFAPEATWLPAETPTPTPYVTPTFAALVDPELSWFDFTTVAPATATPKPSVAPAATQYVTVKTGSDNRSITALQRRLVELGWLRSSQVTGTYDAATTQAVKEFQTYVNEHCSPAVKLTVDGIAGSKTQQWMYDSSVALTKPTPTPSPVVTAAPDTSVIGPSSSASQIRDVQNKLIRLGLLSGKADGKYGSATRKAVSNFQKRVNDMLGYDVLEVNGSIDGLTLAYLNYYDEWWQQMTAATATPTAHTKPTPGATATAKPTATTAPTATATATVEPDDGEEELETIDRSSPKDVVRGLQEQLVAVGLLKAGSADGVYGKMTVAAVKDFQKLVNTNQGAKTLEETGIADSMTRRYLEYYVENGIMAVGRTTEAPTAEPTDAPTQAPTEAPIMEPVEGEQDTYEPENGEGESDQNGITPSSEPESIRYMQEMLATIRLLPEDRISGSYDDSTREAISLFQNFVNEVQGSQTIDVTGICDAETKRYLEYAFERGWDVGTALGIGANDPSEPEGSGDSMDSAAVTNIQSQLCAVGLMNQTTGVYDTVTEQAVLEAQRFINSIEGEGTVPENGVCDDVTLRYLTQAAEQGWNMADVGDMPGEFDDETEPTENEPVEEATPEPTAEPTPEPVAQISGFEIRVNGSSVADSIDIEPGKYSVEWSANGVACYSLYLYTPDGKLVNKQENTTKQGFSFGTDGMIANAPYELRIGALPQGGTAQDMQWFSLYITVKPAETEAPPQPVATEEPFDEPDDWYDDNWNDPDQEGWDDPDLGGTEVVEPEWTDAPAPSYIGTPVINIGSAVYQQGGLTYINDSSAIFSWMADGDVASYNVVLIYEDGTRYDIGTTTETSRTVKTGQLPSGMYTLVVDANPIDGGVPTTAQINFCIPESNPTDTSEAKPEPEQEAPSAPVNTEIQKIQMRLYRYGLLNPDNISEGVLNYETLAAVAEFQQRVNDRYGYNLPVLDPGSATSIDLETINVLLNEDLGL